jgi:hypothetical protein
MRSVPFSASEWALPSASYSDLPLHSPRFRVAVVGRVVIIVIFFAVVFVFLFVLFLVWRLPQEDIGRHTNQ